MAASVRMNKLKETIQVKNKNHLRQQLTDVCCCNERRQKELSREMFSASQVQRFMRTYPIRKRLWNVIKF